MQELRKPEFYRDDHIVLYNDLLILKSIVPSLPGSCYAPISKELAELRQKLLKSNQKGGFLGFFKPTAANISLEIIMKMLQTVEKKNILLEDFLACSGYGRKEMLTKT